MRHSSGRSTALAVGALDAQRELLHGHQAGPRPRMSKLSSPSQLQRRRRVVADELQRQHAHADQIGAVDALEAARDHGAHAEQPRSLGRPVARRAGAVLFAGDDDRRRAPLEVGASPRRRPSSAGRRAGCSRLPAAPSASAGNIRLRMRTLAKVPRIITSWCPRRAP
jgi:hypothetical protein